MKDLILDFKRSQEIKTPLLLISPGPFLLESLALSKALNPDLLKVWTS